MFPRRLNEYLNDKCHQSLQTIYLFSLLICWTTFRTFLRIVKTTLNYLLIKNGDDIDQIHGLNQCAPRRIAFVLADERYVNSKLIATLAHFSLLAGIEQITFCDPWLYLTENSDKFEAELVHILRVQGVNFDGNTVKLAMGKDDKHLKLAWVGVGKDEQQRPNNGLVHVCRQLSRREQSLQPADVFNALFQLDNAQEPDFLVSLGCDLQIGLQGYPPWALRTTEFHSIGTFSNAEYATVSEFVELITKYAQRQRRFGC